VCAPTSGGVLGGDVRECKNITGLLTHLTIHNHLTAWVRVLYFESMGWTHTHAVKWLCIVRWVSTFLLPRSVVWWRVRTSRPDLYRVRPTTIHWPSVPDSPVNYRTVRVLWSAELRPTCVSINYYATSHRSTSITLTPVADSLKQVWKPDFLIAPTGASENIRLSPRGAPYESRLQFI